MELSKKSQAVVPAGLWPARDATARTRKNTKGGRQERARSDYEIRSVGNALDLLEAICINDRCEETEDAVRVTHLSRRLGISKTAVYRLLATFESRGYVERVADSGLYRIGVAAFETGRRLLLRMGVLRHARPVMEELCRRCNEAVYLAIRCGEEFFFIDLVEGAQQVKIAPLVGKRFPLTGAAPGQVLLAFAEAADRSVPVQAAAGIRDNGYHHEQGGLGEMVGCLAAPFFNNKGAVAGALCVVGPSFRMSEGEIEAALLPLLREASHALSSKLGYLQPYSGRVRL